VPEVKVVPVPYDSDFFNKYTVYFDDQPVDSLRGVYFSREGDKHLINSEAYLFGRVFVIIVLGGNRSLAPETLLKIGKALTYEQLGWIYRACRETKDYELMSWLFIPRPE